MWVLRLLPPVFTINYMKKGKLIILQGLPASGKSTKAKELFVNGRNVRVNRDLIREMLHFGEYSKETEVKVTGAETQIARYFIDEGFDVIVDDTNLKSKAIKMWQDLASWLPCELEFLKMDTSLEECIRRDAKREKPIGEERIREMAEWDKQNE